MGLSALLGVKDSTGERVDKALGDPRGQFLPTWLQLGTGLSYTVTKSGNFVTVAIAADTSAVVTFTAVRDALEAATTNVGLNGYGFSGLASLAFDDLASSPSITHAKLVGTGATNGRDLTIKAQTGQDQTGVASNNRGGHLYLWGGDAGTGGSGLAAPRGNVYAEGGNVIVTADAGAGIVQVIGGASGSVSVSLSGGSTMVVTATTLQTDLALNLTPIAEPAAPATGFVLWCDSGDGKLYAKSSASTKTPLANP